MSGTIAKLPVMIVALVIGLILTFTAVMPLVSDYSDAKTFKNEGVFNYGIFEVTDTYNLSVNVTNGVITVNDTNITIPGVDLTHYGSYSIIASDNFLLRYGSNDQGYYVQLIGQDSNSTSILKGGSFDFSITGGQAVFIRNVEPAETYTFDFTELYAIVPSEDDAVMKVSSTSVYIKGDSELYASGITTVSEWNNMFHFEGTYDDGIIISSPNLATATFDNIKWNIEPVSGYIDLYKLTSIEFDITYNDTTVHATYSYFGVPSEVSADPDNPTAYKNLVSVLPLFALIFLVAGAASLVYFKNKD